MAAFLLLSTGSDLTLADVEAWAARARALGATAASPVRCGEPPLAAERNGTVALSVPVTVTRTILPGDAPAESDDGAAADAGRPARASTKASRRSAKATGRSAKAARPSADATPVAEPAADGADSADSNANANANVVEGPAEAGADADSPGAESGAEPVPAGETAPSVAKPPPSLAVFTSGQ